MWHKIIDILSLVAKLILKYNLWNTPVSVFGWEIFNLTVIYTSMGNYVLPLLWFHNLWSVVFYNRQFTSSYYKKLYICKDGKTGLLLPIETFRGAVDAGSREDPVCKSEPQQVLGDRAHRIHRHLELVRGLLHGHRGRRPRAPTRARARRQPLPRAGREARPPGPLREGLELSVRGTPQEIIAYRSLTLHQLARRKCEIKPHDFLLRCSDLNCRLDSASITNFLLT